LNIFYISQVLTLIISMILLFLGNIINREIIVKFSYFSLIYGIIGLVVFVVSVFFKNTNYKILFLSIFNMLYILFATMYVYSKLH